MSRKVKTAEEILREETGEVRHLRTHERIIIGIIAVAWALFQLSIASWLIWTAQQQGLSISHSQWRFFFSTSLW
jgi:TRAP-type uncharacterized transport system fused permease subunit